MPSLRNRLAAWGLVAYLLIQPHSSAEVYRILPLGDSITQGIYASQSYRYRLWIKLVSGGIAFDYVGSKTDNFEGNASYPGYHNWVFDRDHEGHAGWRAQDLLDDCTASDPCTTKNEGTLALWLGTYTPDIVLLHIGSNDIFQSSPQAVTVASINAIISTLRWGNPNVTILLAQIIPLPGFTRDLQVNALNAEIAIIAATRTTSQSPVHLVDQYSGFNGLLDTFDGTHPNELGEEKMAQTWYEAIVAALNPPPPPNDPPVVDAGRDRSISQFRDGISLAGTATDDGNPTPPAALTYAWTQLSGPTAGIDRPGTPVTTADLPSAGDYQFRLSVSDGERVTRDTVEIHLQPFSCPPLHMESGGRVVFEAEHTRSRSHGQGAFATTYWDHAVDRAGYSGNAAMAAYPISGLQGNTLDDLLGCHLDYWVDFATPGLYYAWVRLLGPGPYANSIHLGLNGNPATFGLRGMEDDTQTWQWIGTANHQRVTLQVDHPGRYKIDVWVREIGTYIDRLMLDQNPEYTPVGQGPAASDSMPVCDFDEDGMDDLWEINRWGTLASGATADLDGDAYLNREEYIAGTDPENAGSFPVITAVTGSENQGIAFVSAPGRLYQLEFRDPATDNIEWSPTGPEIPGTGEILVLPDPSPAPTRTYRFRVRATGP